MALVYKCDRCDKIFEKAGPFEPKYTVSKHCFGMNSVELDLCPKCLAYLERFLACSTKVKGENDEKNV